MKATKKKSARSMKAVGTARAFKAMDKAAKGKKKLQRVGSMARQPKKPAVIHQAVIVLDEFRVDMESPILNPQNGTTSYTYSASSYGEETLCRNSMAELKQMGIGGRLVKMDGSPDGQVVEKWGGVGRVLEAEVVEKAALEQEKQ